MSNRPTYPPLFEHCEGTLKEIATFVIGLEHNYRGQPLEEQLDASDISWQRVHGVIGTYQGRPVSDYTDPRAARSLFGRSLSAGEIGCALAHRDVYTRLLGSESDWALVFEDDARVINPDALKALISNIQRDAYIGTPEIITLYGRKVIASQDRAGGRDWATPLLLPPYTTTAYLINRAAAERIVEWSLPLVNPADWPLTIGAAIRFSAVYPWLAMPADGEVVSTVGNREAPATSAWERLARSLRWRLLRFNARSHILWVRYGRLFSDYSSYRLFYFTRLRIEKQMAGNAPYELPGDMETIPVLPSSTRGSN